VLHAFLAVNVVAFSLGIVVLILGALAHRRSARPVFRTFNLLTTAAILYVFLDMVRLYSRAAQGLLGIAEPWVSAVFSGAANGLSAFAIPALAQLVVDLRPRRARAVVNGAAVAVLVALGILDDLLPGAGPTLANTAGLAALQVYGVVIVLARFRRIEDETVRGLARTFVVIVMCGLVLITAERVVGLVAALPAFLAGYNLLETLYFLALAVAVVVYALRYLFQAVPPAVSALPDTFIEKYGISPREREIVSMMLRGYGNRKISETLFISAMTVKNHIYHIYRKTGARNKVQLLNMVNSRK
jgi:DNA-binding CsgD family transcriptional regulator